tara:strand:+ start:919 stop:1683 length:765 start_codon:yes stop_codon:yes gene_type:complete
MKKLRQILFFLLKKILAKNQYQRILFYYHKKKQRKIYKNLSLEGIFSKIYKNNLWDDKSLNNNNSFFSGAGSHKKQIVEPYIEIITKFLKKQNKPIIIDAGCGDFNIGINFVKFSDKYYAFDIVENLIKHNKEKFNFDNLFFEKKDITVDILPSGDILFLRQVLQHLNNSSILKFLKNIRGKFKFLIVTEHVPYNDYKKNLDRISGGFLGNYSGIYLEEEPFNMSYLSKEELLSIPVSKKLEDGLIKTILYKIE